MKKFISQEDMKISNICEALAYIRSKEAVTRKEVQEHMGLSWGGASQIVSRLVALGYVTECKADSVQSAGRTPAYLKVNTEDNFVVGIDINLTGISVKVLNLLNDVLYSDRADADSACKDAFLSGIYSVLDAVFAKFNSKNIIAVGVAMQGSIVRESGISVSLPIDGWERVPIKQLISDRYSVSVYVAHDPDCLLTAGMENELSDALLIRVDDGIGMAVMKNGSLISDTGMLELANTYVPGDESKKLCDFHADRENPDIFFEKLSFALLNTLIIFNVKNVIVCASELYRTHELTKALDKHIHTSLPDASVRDYDINNAAFGAALIAIECFLKNER